MNTRRLFFLLGLPVALLLAGCSNGTDVYESEGMYGMPPTDTAVVQATPTGYRTVSGDPLIVYHDDLEPESMLPYGGGDEGIRQAEDEDVTYMGNGD